MRETMSQFASVKDYYEAKIARLEKENAELKERFLGRVNDDQKYFVEPLLRAETAVDALRFENAKLEKKLFEYSRENKILFSLLNSLLDGVERANILQVATFGHSFYPSQIDNVRFIVKDLKSVAKLHCIETSQFFDCYVSRAKENVYLKHQIESLKCCENCANVPSDGIPADWKKCLECLRYDSEKTEDHWSAKLEAENEASL